MNRLPCVLCLMLAVASATPAATVTTDDGFGVTVDPQGRLTALSVSGRDLPLLPVTGGFYAAEVARTAEEMLPNPGLEPDADGDGIPDGGYSASPFWKRDDAVARSGQWSMRCEVPGTEDVNAGSFGVTVPVEGGGTYLVSFWLKAKGRGGKHPSSIGYLQQQDESGERTTEAFQQMMRGGVVGDTDWLPVSLLLTTEAATRRLYFRTDIYYGYGTVWADDFSCVRLQAEPAPIPVTARQDGEGVELLGRDPDRGLSLEATLRPAGDMLSLTGSLRDTSGRDRCLIPSFRLPLDATGGWFGRDIADRAPIEGPGRHCNATSHGRFGPWSIYPFSSVATGDGSAALSVGVPMHPPQAFRLAYSTSEGLLAEWDLALTPLTHRFPQSAAFSAVFYSHDPAWGFRSAADRYYRLFPEAFEVRCPRQGNWYYCDARQLERPEDFGLMFNEYTHPDSIAADREAGRLTFSYTEPWGWWGWAIGLRPDDDAPAASVEEIMAHIRELSASAEPPEKQSAPWAARSIANSGVRDEEDRPVTCGYVPRWGGHNWALNPAPDAVPEGEFSRFRATYEWEIEPKIAMGVDGIYLDSIVGSWTNIANYRRDHLERANYPLTFSLQDRRPAQLGVWNQYEFVEHLADDLHSRGRLLMANIFPWEWVHFNHKLDVMGHEVFGAEAPASLRAQRTLAYHKPYTWLMQLKPEVGADVREAAMRQAMSYGILPNIVGGTSDPAQYERFRPLFGKYMPTIIALAQAGWEPITHATATPEGVTVERFGPSGEALYFSLRNDTDGAVTAELVADLTALGLDGLSTAARLPEGEAPAVDGNRLRVTMAARDVVVLRIAAAPTD